MNNEQNQNQAEKTPKRVLFVCRGNVARSQIAEALYNKIHPGYGLSAGTKVKEEFKKVSDIPSDMIKFLIETMKEEGIDVAQNSMDQITPEMVEQAEHIVVMAEAETIPEFLAQSEKTEIWDVIDPKGQDKDFYLKTIENIKDRVHQLAAKLNS